MGKHSGINTKLPANKGNMLITTLFVFMLNLGGVVVRQDEASTERLQRVENTPWPWQDYGQN